MTSVVIGVFKVKNEEKETDEPEHKSTLHGSASFSVPLQLAPCRAPGGKVQRLVRERVPLLQLLLQLDHCSQLVH